MLVRLLHQGIWPSYQTVMKAHHIREFDLSSFSGKLKPVQDILEQGVDTETVDDISKYILTSSTRQLDTLRFALLTTREQAPQFEPIVTSSLNEEVSIGYLLLNGTEKWIPIDGYHRLLGLKQAFSQASVKRLHEISQDDISVILTPLYSIGEVIEHIYRMHQSARSVDRGEAIRNALDDNFATLARWLMGTDNRHPGVLPEALINWRSNTLTQRLSKFSTIGVLYDTTKLLLQNRNLIGSVSEEELDTSYEIVSSIWEIVIKHFDIFRQALNGDPRNIPQLRERYLCLSPSGQVAVLGAIGIALEQEISVDDVVGRLNLLSWKRDNPLWQDILISDNRIKSSPKAINLASRYIAYLVGIPQSEYAQKKLLTDYRVAKGKSDVFLPEPLLPQLQ